MPVVVFLGREQAQLPARLINGELGTVPLRLARPSRQNQEVILPRPGALPDLLPDFIVWDEAIAPSRGQILLGAGSARAGGFFGMEWSLPTAIADPLAKTVRPAAKSEYDATPYLP